MYIRYGNMDMQETMETEVVAHSSATYVLIGFFSWTTLYFLLCLCNSRRSYEWHIRSVTVIHAVLIALMTSYCILVVGPWPFTHADNLWPYLQGGTSNYHQSVTVSVCLSYFILDLSWCLYFKTEGLTMLLHHTLSIMGLSSCLITGMWGTEMVTTIFGAEITNPLLQFRWFLRETGRYHGTLGDIVDWSFMIMFGVFRIGIGSYLLYSYYQQDTDFLGRLGGTMIYSVGWVFWINILQYGVHKYKKRLQKVKSTDHKKADKNGVSRVDGSHTQKLANGKELNGNIQKMEEKLGAVRRNVSPTAVNTSAGTPSQNGSL